MKPRFISALLVVLALAGISRAADGLPFRPPAVPLVTSDPYLSIWSEADHLNEDVTRHWTHHPHPLVSLIRVDGKAYRLMGNEPKDVPPLAQKSVEVFPTRSVYRFGNEQVDVTMTFMTAALPSDLDVLTRPLSYISWEVKSADGSQHAVEIYDSTSGLLAVEKPEQKVNTDSQLIGSLMTMNVGTADQTLFTPAGDDTRIDWGYAYAAAPAAQSTSSIGSSTEFLKAFADGGKFPPPLAAKGAAPAATSDVAMAFIFDLGKVGGEAVSRHVMVAYDEVWSINFFGKKLRPYWRRNGAQPGDLLQTAEKDYPSLVTRCEAFDKDLMADLTKVGGEKYAQIAALAYRECLAANGIAADANKQPLLFTKENTSNGDIATVDVIFPMDPIFVALSPTLCKASLVGVLNYGASPRWKFPCAPHDLGTYPVARGTDDGGEAMPVEESGNILILVDAIAHGDGNADFATPWWPKLTQWAQYLEQYGLDPEEQLCTDDFMGHLAHNSNLSVKGILALAAYGDLCRMRGDLANADKYQKLAKADAAHWMTVAMEGDHSKLAYDKSNTWSQKYNLVWDKILGLNVFPPTLAQQEVAHYKKVMEKYGVPLDSRTKLTKTDWSLWVATMADNRADFESFANPIWDYLNETSTRDPIADSYETNNVHSGGMHARPVVGGFFIKMLSDADIWKKWAGQDKAAVGDWAPLPVRPTVRDVVPTSQKPGVIWSYTFEKPAADWTQPGFDDSAWKKGEGVIGNHTAIPAPQRTTWDTADVWVRRKITMPEGSFSNLALMVYHDEDVEIYIDGLPAGSARDFNNQYEPVEIAPPALAHLKPGAAVTLSAHCHQTVGGQGIDFGIVDVVEGKRD